MALDWEGKYNHVRRRRREQGFMRLMIHGSVSVMAVDELWFVCPYLSCFWRDIFVGDLRSQNSAYWQFLRQRRTRNCPVQWFQLSVQELFGVGTSEDQTG